MNKDVVEFNKSINQLSLTSIARTTADINYSPVYMEIST